jgi:hypothetical protein
MHSFVLGLKIGPSHTTLKKNYDGSKFCSILPPTPDTPRRSTLRAKNNPESADRTF